MDRKKAVTAYGYKMAKNMEAITDKIIEQALAGSFPHQKLYMESVQKMFPELTSADTMKGNGQITINIGGLSDAQISATQREPIDGQWEASSPERGDAEGETGQRPESQPITIQ